MTAAAKKVVEAFEALDRVEQQRVLGKLLEIADNMPLDDDSFEDELHAAAASTFARYDAEEEAAERNAKDASE